MKLLMVITIRGIVKVNVSINNIDIEAFRNLLLSVCDFIKHPTIKSIKDNISSIAKIIILALNI